MLAVWKEWCLDSVLKKAYENDIIMSGVSAGAICWFEKGITDSFAHHQAIIPCLGFVKGICCPHYDEEPERIPYVKEVLEGKKIDQCIAIEGYCALHLINDEPRFSVSFKNETNTHHVVCNNSEIIHNKLPNVEKYYYENCQYIINTSSNCSWNHLCTMDFSPESAAQSLHSFMDGDTEILKLETCSFFLVHQ